MDDGLGRGVEQLGEVVRDSDAAGIGELGVGNRGEQTQAKMPAFDQDRSFQYLEQLKERLGEQALKNFGY